MKYTKYIFALLGVLILGDLFSQNTNPIIHVRYFVKTNSILFRIAPNSKTSFDAIKKQTLSVKRYTLINGMETNEKVITKNLSPYSTADSSLWLKLFKKDKDKGAFVYNSIYNNVSEENSNKQKTFQNENILYHMLLLSCDYDKEIAKACGLFIEDSLIENSVNYIYKFYLNVPRSNSIELAKVQLDASELSTDAEIKDLKAKFKNNRVTLKWNAKKYNQNFSAYYIERSSDGTNYSKLNDAPLILLTDQFEKDKTDIVYTDTMKILNTKYFYRIRGINFFGEYSKPSNTCTGMAYAVIRSQPVIDSISIFQNRSIIIQWRMDNKKENSLPKEYVLMRSIKENGRYEYLFKTNTLYTYTDQSPKQTNYYKIGAVTFSGDTLFSFSRMANIVDTIPPVIPSGLIAAVDKKGNVILRWNKNKETDLQGYKLFGANSINEEFVQLNNKFISDTSYQLKLNLKTLTKNSYFKISACDLNYNNSKLSNAIRVERPDTIPPSAPLIIGIQNTKNGIQIKCIKSISADLKEHELYRKEENSKEFILISKVNFKDTSNVILDSTAIIGKGFYYKLTAIDSSSNISTSNIPYYKYETGYRQKISEFKGFVNRDRRTISLSWKYSDNQIEKFIIYRKNQTDPLGILKTLPGNNFEFEDLTPNIGNTYEYRIKAVLVNGTESIISDKLLVEF